MKKVKYFLGLLAVLGAAYAVHFVLKNEKTLVTHPKGIIAEGQLHLISTNILLMLIIIVPVLILLLFTILKYRAKNSARKYDPDHSSGILGQVVMWVIPSVIIAIMIPVTWKATHTLDPYRPLEGDVQPLKIQVVALDWKWLFIYPELGIASLNFFQIPEKTPIHFSLSADGSPMNSFWLPQLSGQIYCMTGMTTPLHLMADEAGEYTGRAAEINGEGFADMTFIAKSTSHPEFEEWVDCVRKSPLQLTDSVYQELAERSQNNPIVLYSYVEEDLFNKIVMKTL
jgi:cytochrome o ubiquinol oxidase subunit 2